MIIRSRAPVRISFAGGGTDIAPYCYEKGGCVVSATINKFAWATLQTRNDNEMCIESYDFLRKLRFGSLNEITYNNDLDLIKAVIKRMNHTGRGVDLFLRSDVPPKSGLGSSASAFSALIGVFSHLMGDKRLTDYEIAELAYDLERKELGIAGGFQDQYATVFGGLNFIEFRGDNVRVNKLRIKRDHVRELEKHLVLFHVAKREESGDILKDQRKRYEDRHKGVEEAMDNVKKLAIETKHALVRGDLEGFGKLLHESWENKKKFSPHVTTPFIDKLYSLARDSGALGGKITGAGGGGHFMFYCEPNKEQIVTEKLAKAGATPVPFTFTKEGLVTWDVNS